MTPFWVEEKTLVSKAGSGAQFKETKPILGKKKVLLQPITEATASSCGIEMTMSKVCFGWV